MFVIPRGQRYVCLSLVRHAPLGHDEMLCFCSAVCSLPSRMTHAEGDRFWVCVSFRIASFSFSSLSSSYTLHYPSHPISSSSGTRLREGKRTLCLGLPANLLHQAFPPSLETITCNNTYPESPQRPITAKSPPGTSNVQSSNRFAFQLPDDQERQKLTQVYEEQAEHS